MVVNRFAIIAATFMRRHRLWIVLAVLIVVAAFGAAIYIRAINPPEAARLLPADAEAIIYVNFKPLRAATDFGRDSVVHEPEYAEFIKATGFQFERDLDEVAIAVHPPEKLPGTEPAVSERRFSDVFVGRFDSIMLKHYLHKLAGDVESYRDTEVFVIPYQGRTVRVAILSMDSVAVSNSADSAHIRFMIDRYYKAGLPFSKNWMLRQNYKHVPFGSSAWAVAQFKVPNREEHYLPFPGGVNLTLPRNTVTVASLRYAGDVQFRVEALTTGERNAEKLAESFTTFLNLFRSIEMSLETKGPDADVKAFFESLDVQQEGKSVVLKADLSPAFLKKLVADTPAAAVAPSGEVPASTSKSTKKP
jgi:hypothetical protein